LSTGLLDGWFNTHYKSRLFTLPWILLQSFSHQNTPHQWAANPLRCICNPFTIQRMSGVWNSAIKSYYYLLNKSCDDKGWPRYPQSAVQNKGSKAKSFLNQAFKPTSHIITVLFINWLWFKHNDAPTKLV
jgi:hypothetical protein